MDYQPLLRLDAQNISANKTEVEFWFKIIIKVFSVHLMIYYYIRLSKSIDIVYCKIIGKV